MKDKKILVVEDNLINQEVVVAILEKLGYSVASVSSGISALDLAEKENFSIIFMDCHMPQMDGILATQKIRQREAQGQHRTKIIAMSADSTPEYQQKCLSAGMDDFISKPASFQDFKRILEKLPND